MHFSFCSTYLSPSCYISALPSYLPSYLSPSCHISALPSYLPSYLSAFLTYMPLVDNTERRLQVILSFQLFISLISGLMLRYRSLEKASRVADDLGDAGTEDMIFEIILSGLTIAVIICAILTFFMTLADIPLFRAIFACMAVKEAHEEIKNGDDNEDDGADIHVEEKHGDDADGDSSKHADAGDSEAPATIEMVTVNV